MAQHDDEFRFLKSDAAQVGYTGELPEVRRVSVEVSDGRKVSALQFSPESAPQIVFLHGVGLNAHGFDPVALALGVPAISIDLPGHGHSDWRSDANYRPDYLAADVLLALDQLAPEPFYLVGHSLGGLTSAVLAAQLGDRIKGLAILDITPGIVPQSDAGDINDFISGKRAFASQEEMVDRAIEYGIGEDRAALTRGVALNSRLREDGQWEWAHHFAHITAGPMENLGEGKPFAALWAPLVYLSKHKLPIVLFQASDGLVGEELAAEWREMLPDAKLVLLPGLHNLQESSPVELAAALAETFFGK
ncbi:alpha/beta hydrolase [Leucobacter sp. UT-8R-CII-1-4]|uniref:alpha/beta fold hydrolase n=1 Tax=Leucobacter sp. UT-8R-CII-1-4 TaxID=3040075 RepID=UPI0024A8F9F2|nr:alpha/beta hydrolase [Leucobacter sp. UT-8R-CII-1-4]MDI6022069.1 alpha/beta hydrolase [Leucobacter sp. UT-8R-CII-1-4]